MPRDKAKRVTTLPRLIAQVVDDPTTARAIADLATAVQRTEDRHGARDILTADITAGANTINHGLGRKPRGCSVTPTVAAADFAWAMTRATPTQLTITAVGTTQPNAVIEVY